MPLQKLTEKLNLKRLVTNNNVRNLLVLQSKTCCRKHDKNIKDKLEQLKMNLYNKCYKKKDIFRSCDK